MTAKSSRFSGSGRGSWEILIGDWGYQPPRDPASKPPVRMLRDAAVDLPGTVRAEVTICAEARYADTEHLSLIVWFDSIDGVIEIVQLLVRPGFAHAPGGLVSTDLRDIPLHEISRELLKRFRTGEPPWGWENEDGSASWATPTPPPRGWATNLAKRPGRSGKGDLHYARAAAEYVRFLDQPKPLLRLAKRLRLEPSQVRSILYEARRRDLLTDPEVKGRAGGHLTPKALDILRRHDEGNTR